MMLTSGFHRHHINPRYRGGDDSPENLVLLHPIDHAIAHLVRFKMYGHPADGWAYNRVVNGLKDDLIPNRKGIPKPYMRKPKSEETKAKMSAAAMGKKKSPEAVEKMRQANLEKKATPAQRAALEANQHLAHTKEARAKKSATMKGRALPWLKGKAVLPSKEACAAGGRAAKGRKQTPEQIAKRVASRRATLLAQERTR